MCCSCSSRADALKTHMYPEGGRLLRAWFWRLCRACCLASSAGSGADSAGGPPLLGGAPVSTPWQAERRSSAAFHQTSTTFACCILIGGKGGRGVHTLAGQREGLRQIVQRRIQARVLVPDLPQEVVLRTHMSWIIAHSQLNAVGEPACRAEDQAAEWRGGHSPCSDFRTFCRTTSMNSTVRRADWASPRTPSKRPYQPCVPRHPGGRFTCAP